MTMYYSYRVSRYKSEALLNARDFTTAFHKYSLTVARYATVVVAVPYAVHYPTNYKIKIYYFR
jgi:hypothetical protein